MNGGIELEGGYMGMQRGNLPHVADIELRHFFVNRHQGTVVEIPFAPSRQRFEKLSDHGGDRDGNRTRARSGQRDSQVLTMQVGAKSGGKLMSDHRLAL